MEPPQDVCTCNFFLRCIPPQRPMDACPQIMGWGTLPFQSLQIFIGRTDAEAQTPILGPLMRRTDSFEKTLMLGKIEGRRRRGQQRMRRWLDGITNSMDMGFSKLHDREAWRDAVHGLEKSRTWLSDWTELIPPQKPMGGCPQIMGCCPLPFRSSRNLPVHVPTGHLISLFWQNSAFTTKSGLSEWEQSLNFTPLDKYQVSGPEAHCIVPHLEQIKTEKKRKSNYLPNLKSDATIILLDKDHSVNCSTWLWVNFIGNIIRNKESNHVWFFVTQWTVAHQDLEFFRKKYWSKLPFPSPGDLPDPWIEPGSLALQADSLPSEPPREAHIGNSAKSRRNQ